MSMDFVARQLMAHQSAWLATRQAPRPQGRGDVTVAAADSAVDVLCAAAGPGMLAGAIAAATAGGGYRFHLEIDASAQRLNAALASRCIDVLLIDLDTCRRLGPDELRSLRRGWPVPEWIVVGDDLEHHGLDVLLQCRAHGVLGRQASVGELRLALEAVAVGDLWIPLDLLGRLFLALRHRSAADDPSFAPLALNDGMASLTPREVEVMALLRRGLSNKQIAAQLGISINTVKKHLARSYAKRGLRQRRQLLA